MLRSLLLQLQVERKVKPPKFDVASLGITVHAEFSLSLRSWRDFARESFCFGSEAVKESSKALRGLVKSPVELPEAG